MVLGTVRGYIQFANGLTNVTRQWATATARTQISAVVDEIIEAGRANGEMVIGLVHAEVDRAVAGLGLVTRDDFEALGRSVDRLVALQGSGRGSAGTMTKKAVTKKAVTPEERTYD